MRYHVINHIAELQRKTSPHLYSEGQVRESQNFDFHTTIGVAKKAGDYTQLGNQITASQDILGMGSFVRGGSSSGTYEKYAVCDGASNSDIYKLVTATWTAQSQSLTAAARGNFASMPERDTLFFVNYSDATRSYAGSSWSTSTDVTSAPKARYANVHQARLFLLNCDVGGTDYPARYYHSSDATEGELTWDTTNDYYVMDSTIMGVEENGEDQLVFTLNSVYRADAYDKHLLARTGTTSGDSIVTMPSGWTIYANDKGLFATDGRTDQKISQAINEYWPGIANTYLNKFMAAGLGDLYCIYVDDLTLPETFTKVMFAYDTSSRKFEKYSLKNTPTSMKTLYHTTGEQRLYFGDDNGETFEFLPATKAGQDTGVYTAYLEFPPIEATGDVTDYRSVDVWGNTLNGTTALIKGEEDKPWQPVRRELRGYYTRLPFNLRSRKLYLKLLHSGKVNNPDIHKLRIGYV